MKDTVLCLPVAFSTLAQISSQQDSWERLGIAGLSIAVTIFMWRYFIAKEAEAKREHAEKEAVDVKDRKDREAADAAERNRLLEIQNKLQSQVVELLIAQKDESTNVARLLVASQKDFLKAHEDGQRSIKELARKIPSSRVVTIDNGQGNPVPVAVEDHLR